MTCPHCGARNTADAPWCTQCLQPLGQDPSTASATSTPPADRGAGELPPSPVPAPAPGGTHDSSDGAFRSVGGQVQWRCPACETWNALDAPSCTICGARLATSVTGARASQVSGRVSRARRVLWVVAAIGGGVAVVSLVLLLLALRGGVPG